MSGKTVLSRCNESHSVTPSALEIGDIIVSTTPKQFSAAIREIDGSPVSHSMVYAGNGDVVEAIGDGVVVRSLQDALDDASVAVVYRSPDISFGDALAIASSAASHEGSEYDIRGLVTSVFDSLCGKLDGEKNFFCSELVTEAYNSIGNDLTGKDPACSTPRDIVDQYTEGNIEYTGHLVVNDPNFDKVVMGSDHELGISENGWSGNTEINGYDPGGEVCEASDYFNGGYDQDIGDYDIGSGDLGTSGYGLADEICEAGDYFDGGYDSGTAGYGPGNYDVCNPDDGTYDSGGATSGDPGPSTGGGGY